MPPMAEPEKIESIAEALKTWDRGALHDRVETATELREQFVERFPLSAWPEMTLDSYALGQQIEGGTVGWWLEFHTRRVASMSGGNAKKHLIWRGTDGTWRYPKDYATVEEAWDAVRAGFIEVF